MHTDLTALSRYDDRTIQMMLREVEMDDLTAALHGANREQWEPVTRNMSARAVTLLTKYVEECAPPTPERASEARSKLLKLLDTVKG